VSKIVDFFNNTYTKLGGILIFIILIFIGGVFYNKQIQENKQLKEEEKSSKNQIEILNLGIANSEKHVSILQDSVEYFKQKAINQSKVSNIIKIKTNKVYENTKKRVASIDSVPNDSLSILFSKLARQYKNSK